MLQLEDIILKQGDMVFFKNGTSMIITQGGSLASDFPNVKMIRREGKVFYSDVNKMHICEDCKLYIPETEKSTYMVTHDLWGELGLSDEYLCLDCFEKRLGRPLRISDFLLNVPCNYFNKYLLDEYYSTFLTKEEINIMKKAADIEQKIEDKFWKQG